MMSATPSSPLAGGHAGLSGLKNLNEMHPFVLIQMFYIIRQHTTLNNSYTLRVI
jgi:hypothetical protein